MSFRTRVLGMVDVFMRVPPLFVIDEILKISMGFPTMTITITRPSVSSPNHGVGDIDESMLDSFVNGAFEAINETLNATMGDAATAAVDLAPEDYFKVLSLTTLKFFACLVGESYYCSLSRSPFLTYARFILSIRQFMFDSIYFIVQLPCCASFAFAVDSFVTYVTHNPYPIH